MLCPLGETGGGVSGDCPSPPFPWPGPGSFFLFAVNGAWDGQQWLWRSLRRSGDDFSGRPSERSLPALERWEVCVHWRQLCREIMRNKLPSTVSCNVWFLLTLSSFGWNSLHTHCTTLCLVHCTILYRAFSTLVCPSYVLNIHKCSVHEGVVISNMHFCLQGLWLWERNF